MRQYPPPQNNILIKKRGNNKWLQTRIKYQICGFYVVLFIDKTVESFSNKEIGCRE